MSAHQIIISFFRASYCFTLLYTTLATTRGSVNAPVRAEIEPSNPHTTALGPYNLFGSIITTYKEILPTFRCSTPACNKNHKPTQYTATKYAKFTKYTKFYTKLLNVLNLINILNSLLPPFTLPPPPPPLPFMLQQGILYVTQSLFARHQSQNLSHFHVKFLVVFIFYL